MASVREIRNRVKSVKKTQKITKAMKMVSAARLRRAQETIFKARPYAYKLNEVLQNVASRIDRSLHPLLEEHKIENVAYVVVTGDRGLCGGFNSYIIRKTKEIIKQDGHEHYKLICVGKKGDEHFRGRDYPILDSVTRIFTKLKYAHAQLISDKIIDLYVKNDLDKVVLIYNEFKSAIQQNVVVEQLLPVVTSEDSEKIKTEYQCEPSPLRILDTLLPLQVSIQIWRVLLESSAAVHAARMTAMESATDNAAEMINSLTLTMNRARQAQITTEIAEIVGGAEALK